MTVYVDQLFSACLYFLIKNLDKNVKIIVDMEYPGRDKLIIKLTEDFLEGKFHNQISFKRIGNSPKVHYAAHDVFSEKKQPDKIISQKEIVRLIKKTDGRLRECLSTLVNVQPRPYNVKIAKKLVKVNPDLIGVKRKR